MVLHALELLLFVNMDSHAILFNYLLFARWTNAWTTVGDVWRLQFLGQCHNVVAVLPIDAVSLLI